MEDQTQTQTQTQNPTSPRTQCSLERNHEQVRSRWTPKPEQILILESIFNSGMVNPPKEETVKIRKLLEKFGSVGDANVFYWFQNRRSRSRRRQRQIQASLISSGAVGGCGTGCGGGGEIEYQDAAYTTTAPGFVLQQPSFPTVQSTSPLAGSSSSPRPGGEEGIYSISGQAASFPKTEYNASMSSSFQHLNASKAHYEIAPRVIKVFINGVPMKVESGPLNTKVMFGQDLMLVHSSGVPMPLDEYGMLVPGLQYGESYFLVRKGC